MQVSPSPFAHLALLTVTKTVLVAQGQPWQAQLWKSVLESQRHAVVLVSPQADLVEVAATHPPDLMVVDMTTGLFNPYAFCRECRSRLPDIPVILTHHPRRRIEPAERRWAIYQGAAEVIPGLAEADDILHSLEQVYKAARWPFPIDTAALHAVLEQAGLRPEKDTSLPSPPVAPEERQEQTAAPPPAKYRLMYRGRPVE